MNSKSQISQKNSKNCELGNHFFFTRAKAAKLSILH